MRHITIFLIVALGLGSCSLFGKSDEGPVYMVVDKGTNTAISTYYTDGSERITRTESYDGNEFVSRVRDFEYDDSGYVRAMTERSAGGAERTVMYTTTVVRGESGRIEKIVQRSDDGEELETFFGYDEEGTLRGSVVRSVGTDSVVMKDYDE